MSPATLTKPFTVRGPGTNSPVEDVTSAAIACNVKGEVEASGFLQVAAGDTLEAECEVGFAVPGAEEKD